MITFMRRYRKALQIGLLIVIAAFVASLFVFGSSGITNGPQGDWVARVNGEAISTDRYQRRYQAYVDMYSQIYRDRFTPQLAERLGLPQQVVNDLVQEAVVVQRARSEGLELSDDELNARIHQINAFHDNGRFSVKKYQELLKRRGMTPTTFEADVRRELTRTKVEQLVRNGVKVSDAEVDRHWALQRETVRAAWAFVEFAPLIAAATATDQEVEQYLKDHQAEFRQPDRRRIQYVVVTPSDFKKPVPDADVEQYYKEHVQEFETPRQVRMSHVLARVAETGGSAAEDKAKAKVADAIRRVRAGEPFAKVAKELSEDPGSAPNGGDLGFIGKGELVPDFEKAAMALKPGEITPEPVRTPFGFHAITVTEIREGSKKPLAAVSQQIRDKLAVEVTDKAAQARAAELRIPLQASKDFMAEAKKLGVTAIETRVAKAETPLPVPDSIEETAFTLALGGVSAPIKTPTGYMIVKAVEHLPASVPPLTEIRGAVLAAVKRTKGEAAAVENAKKVADAAKSGDMVAVAKSVGATTGETTRFSRQKPAEKIPGDAMMAAIQTAAGGVTAPVKTTQGYYVLKVLDRAPAETAELAQERDKLSQELLQQKQGQAWESWIAAARTNAKIEVSPRFNPPRTG